MLGGKNENHFLTFITSSLNCSSQSFFLLEHHLHMFSFIILKFCCHHGHFPPFSSSAWLFWGVFNLYVFSCPLNQNVPHVCRFLYCYCILVGLFHSDENKWHRVVQTQKRGYSVLFHCSVIIDVLFDCNSTPSSNNVIMWQHRCI